MGKKPEKINSIKTALCHPKNPCGTCFACNLAGVKQGWNTANAGCLGLIGLFTLGVWLVRR